MWQLSEAARSELLQLAETGSGFQWVIAGAGATRGPFLVFNAAVAYDLSGVELIEGDDFAAILSNSSRVVDALRRDGTQIIRCPQPSGFELLGMRGGSIGTPSGSARRSSKPLITLPS